MNRTDRLHAIVEELRRAGPRGRTSEQLAHHFEVSARTIKRDIDGLQQAGHPIWATGGPGGGYVLDMGASLPPMNFTAAEAVAIAVALSQQPNAHFRADGRSALAKVFDAMPHEMRERAERLAGRVWYRARTTGQPGSVVGVVEQALALEVVLRFDYTDAAGATTHRTVDPLHLGIDGPVSYLFAWDRQRDAARSFRLDRMTNPRLTRTPASPRALEEAFDGDIPDDVARVLGTDR